MTQQRPWYGQVVVGPPGSGKTTYCNGMQQYLRLLGRNAWVINLDPANEAPSTTKRGDNNQQDEEEVPHLPYETLVDVCEDIIQLSSVMQQLELGPNGGLVYCMEYLEAHVDHLVELIHTRSMNHPTDDNDNNNNNNKDRPEVYLLLDLPGQVELYTHGTMVQRLLATLVSRLDLRLCAVQLMDSQYCTEATKFISAALLGTTTMLRLELPCVNVLSKVDLLPGYYGGDANKAMPFGLDYFTDCHDLQRLIPFLHTMNGNNNDDDDDDTSLVYAEDPEYQQVRRTIRESVFYRKHEKLHKAMAEVVEDFGLLSFLPLDISNAESVGRVLACIDKCNGYVFAPNTNQSSTTQKGDLFQCAVQSDDHSRYETIADIQERLQDNSMSHSQEQQETETTSNT